MLTSPNPGFLWLAAFSTYCDLETGRAGEGVGRSGFSRAKQNWAQVAGYFLCDQEIWRLEMFLEVLLLLFLLC